MAYDDVLAERIRDRLRGVDGVTQKRMFGGLAFLTHGNMTVGVIGDDLIVRVGPEATAAALTRPGAREFDMTGRPMKGWILVEPAGTKTTRQLTPWVGRGVRFALTLPPKG
jgi:TfoX/Sxy family transcriptional regulator of competence genes